MSVWTGIAVWLPLIISCLYGSAGLGKDPLPVRPTARPSHLTDWILVGVAVVIIFAILHRLHQNRSKAVSNR